MCLSHCDGRVHLILINTHVNLTIHRIGVWPTSLLDVTAARHRSLHRLAIQHMVDLVPTVLRLSISVWFTAKWFFILTLFLIYHHRWLNLRFYNWSSQLLLHLLRYFVVLTTWRGERFCIDGTTRLLPLMRLLNLKVEFVLRTFLT